jgi:hypothetical protein
MSMSKPAGTYKFHDQQIAMSDRIISAFTSGEGELYAILLAQMQSGKSGTYLRVALECVHRGFFKNVHIICGSRDTALRDQTNKSLAAAIDAFVNQIDIPSVPGISRDIIILGLKSNFVDSIKVSWNQELKGVEIDRNCLIINDESHTAQSKVNIPFKQFWKKNGLEKCLCGDFTPLRERDIRVLSVSATSFSECVQNQKVALGIEPECDVPLTEKNVFIMDVNDTPYRGVSDFLQNGNIHFSAEPISEKTNGDHLAQILMLPKYSKKFCIVRTAAAGKDENLMKDIAARAQVLYIPVHGDKIKDSLHFLCNQPAHTALVHICGIARMGQELSKKHVGFVYEQSKSPAIDTLLQGLLGRMCGYDSNTDIDIFISKARKLEIEKYARAVKSSAEECRLAFAEMGPALNIKKVCGGKHTHGDTVQDKDGNFWRKMVPIKFPYSMLEHEVGDPSINHSDLHNLFEDNPQIILGNPDVNFIMSELNNPQHSDSISNRDLSAPAYNTNHKTKRNLDVAIKKGNRCTDWFTNVVNDHHTNDVRAFTVLHHHATPTDVYLLDSLQILR